MLFAVRAKKFGMVTIMAVLSGLLMGFTGMGFWGVLTGAVFSLWMVGTYIPMYFMAEQARADFAAGFGQEYADKVMAVMPMWSFILVIAGIFLCALLGGLIGKAILKKHFVKAGIV